MRQEIDLFKNFMLVCLVCKSSDLIIRLYDDGALEVVCNYCDNGEVTY